jgi:hypothetical protein
MDISSQPQSSVSKVSTAVPRRYLGQLCKHFQHKLPVTYAEHYETGRIEFSVGSCELEADEAQGVLTMHAYAANDADLSRLEDVVARHLVRFAFRETLDLTWARTS